ncbi:MAG TPA: hypothetical protein VMX38_12570 [Verrucomicrobiae bacterium]|jgi:hypothetical protein|nr:hypothetical protein [Verrucomicrobiae bacterium]
MPCRYLIDLERGIVVSSGWGRVTYAEMMAHQDRLVKDPDFYPELDQLVDGTAVTELNLSPEEAKAIGSRKFFSPQSKRAFLASSLQILSVARIVQQHAQREKNREAVSVFHDRKAALEWLGLRESPR